MNNSLKAGIISGLIAGFVLGIALEFFTQIAISLGFYDPFYRQFVAGNLLFYIPLGIFWGVIYGIIYLKTYSLIPKKGILKGLIYGLFLYLITTIRIYFYLIPYGLVQDAVGDFFSWFFIWIFYGLTLGFLYDFLSNRYYPIKEKKKIITYNISSGLLPGAIAGLCGGMAASVVQVIGHVTGYWGVPVEGQIISTIDFWMSQAGTHILINLIWGTIFGGLFAKVYNLVPGKKIKKGLYYGLIMVLITSFFITHWDIPRYAYLNEWGLALVILLGQSTSFANAIVFGLVLGLLYRKPSK